MVTEIVGDGTAEATWRPWLDGRSWPALEPLPQHVVVVAPHPDDEVLGLGGLMAMADGVTVVAVTDGEASHPRSTVYGREELAFVRRVETSRALRRLRTPDTELIRLGEADGKIDETRVREALTRQLWPGAWCFATWRADGHPDHETVGAAAAAACASTGAHLFEYPIWMWHWADPDDSRVPWSSLQRFELNDATLDRKTAAIEAFRSQTAPLGPEPGDAPILPPPVLARFLRPYEVVFR